MKLLLNYLYTKGRDLWRLLPAGTDKLLIEERDRSTKEAFFSCIEMSTGKFIFEDYQPAEKIWCGIETIYNHIIFFHRYAKPEMPAHSGIIAYDFNKGEVKWQNDEYAFLLIRDDKLYCYKSKFEGRIYFELDYLTGEVLRELGEDYTLVNALYESISEDPLLKGYLFPETYIEGKNLLIDKRISALKTNKVIAGKTDIIISDDVIYLSFHTVNDNGSLTNRFYCIEIKKKKIILEEILNQEINAFIPDSFFKVNSLLFLLVDKKKLRVYSITK